MSPDEVVKKLGDMSSESNHNEFNVLASAISLLQDYQKLRERVSVEKIVANVPFYQNIMPVERQEIVKQIVTYLQQPTEPR